MSHTAADRRAIAARLREARATLGLTQQDAATAMGLHRSAVAALETAARNITGPELARFARLYRRPVTWLLGEPDEPLDAALFSATARLPEDDRAMVLRFARFLASQAGGAR